MPKSNDDGAYRPDETIPKKPKDTKGPTRPMSAYFLYAGDVRQKTRQDNPDLKIGQISKLIANEWAKVADKKKKKYSDKTNKAMEEYKKKMDKHKKSAAYKKFKSDLEEWNEVWK
eukprot:861602_1